jgi:hypothetical protein
MPIVPPGRVAPSTRAFASGRLWFAVGVRRYSPSGAGVSLSARMSFVWGVRFFGVGRLLASPTFGRFAVCAFDCFD